MNIQRLTALAELFENFDSRHGELGFSMGTLKGPAVEHHAPDTSGHDCKTVCCIAGWTRELFDPRPDTISFDWVVEAGRLLDLSEDTAVALFVPAGVFSDFYTPAHAAKVIRGLIETGKVNWPPYVNKRKENL